MTKDIIEAFNEGYNKGYQACKEALSTTQPESVVLNNRTVQKPLSGMEILELAEEYRLDVVMSDAINFAQAIEKRIRTGE